MRTIFVVFIFVVFGSPSLADCELNLRYGRIIVPESFARDVEDAVECLEKRLDLLEYQNVVLREQIAILEEIAALVPSNYLEVDGQDNGATAPFAVANFELTAKPKGRAFEMALDHAVVLDLCADAEGCVVSLLSTSQTARNSDNLGKIGPCNMLYDEGIGLWEFGVECGGGWGIDGGGRLPGAESPEGSVVLSIGNDCALTESSLNVRADVEGQAQLAQDRKQGLYLITGLNADDDLVPEDDYYCRLTLRD